MLVAGDGYIYRRRRTITGTLDHWIAEGNSSCPCPAQNDAWRAATHSATTTETSWAAEGPPEEVAPDGLGEILPIRGCATTMQRDAMKLFASSLARRR